MLENTDQELERSGFKTHTKIAGIGMLVCFILGCIFPMWGIPAVAMGTLAAISFVLLCVGVNYITRCIQWLRAMSETPQDHVYQRVMSQELNDDVELETKAVVDMDGLREKAAKALDSFWMALEDTSIGDLRGNNYTIILNALLKKFSSSEDTSDLTIVHINNLSRVSFNKIIKFKILLMHCGISRYSCNDDVAKLRLLMKNYASLMLSQQSSQIERFPSFGYVDFETEAYVFFEGKSPFKNLAHMMEHLNIFLKQHDPSFQPKLSDPEKTLVIAAEAEINGQNLSKESKYEENSKSHPEESPSFNGGDFFSDRLSTARPTVVRLAHVDALGEPSDESEEEKDSGLDEQNATTLH